MTIRPDWLLHFRHAWEHIQAAQSLLAQGDRAEALQHITEAHADLAWVKRQLKADLETPQ